MRSIPRIKMLTTTGAVPSALLAGELAINEVDGKLFWRNHAGNVVSADIRALSDIFASPALTGNPTTPTQSPGNNSTRLANTAFVTAAIAGLINSAPGALDTLKELADAIGDDANYAATITAALAQKAPLASPALTGTPIAPTAGAGTNTTQLATTAFVTAAVAALINSAPGALDTLKELADAIGDDANYAATITAALALKAPLASPALTGTPSAPTAGGGTNTTQIATTAFVTAAVAALVNSAPGALDTLKELADAIGDDANYAATITAALALKAPLASPALTGTPSAPTAAGGTNTTQLATTAFVKAAIDVVLGGVAAAYDTLAELAAWITDVEGAWTAYTPTVTPGAGAFTSASTSGSRYRRLGSSGSKTYLLEIVLTVTTVGSAVNNCTFSLPAGTLAARATFAAADQGTGGFVFVTGFAGQTTIYMLPPGATFSATTYTISGIVEIT